MTSPNQELQGELTSGRPRRANSIVSVWSLTVSRARKSWCFTLSIKIGQSWCPSWRQWSRKYTPVLTRGSDSLFCLGLQVIVRGPPTLGRAICFTQATKSNVNLIQIYPHTITQNDVWLTIWAPYGPVKLTHKISYDRF